MQQSVPERFVGCSLVGLRDENFDQARELFCAFGNLKHFLACCQSFFKLTAAELVAWT